MDAKSETESDINNVNNFKTNRKSTRGRISDFSLGRRKSRGLSVLGSQSNFLEDVPDHLPIEKKLSKIVEMCFQGAVHKVADKFGEDNSLMKLKILVKGDEACQDFVKLNTSSGVLKQMIPPERKHGFEIENVKSYTSRLENEGELWNEMLINERKELIKTQKKLKNVIAVEVIEPISEPSIYYNAINDDINEMRRELTTNLNIFNETVFELEAKNSEIEKRIESKAELIKKACEMTISCDFDSKAVLEKLDEEIL